MTDVPNARRTILRMEDDVRSLPPQLAALSAYLRLAAADDDVGIEVRECRGLHEMLWKLYEQAERIVAVYDQAVSPPR